jgi:hypothetical protein
MDFLSNHNWLLRTAALVLLGISLVGCGAYGATASSIAPVANVATVVPSSLPTDVTPSPMSEHGVVGPGCFVDKTNHLSLQLASGWNAQTSGDFGYGGTTSLYNYGPDAVKSSRDAGSYPPGGVKVTISTTMLKSGQSFEDWLSGWSAPKTPGVILPPPDYQPYTLGKYEGVSRLVSNDTGGTLEIILPLNDGRVVVIGVSPADSPSLSDALSILSTLDVSGTDSCSSSAMPVDGKKI